LCDSFQLQFGLYEGRVAVHRPETVPAVPGVAGRRPRHRGWPQVSGGRARRHEVHDEKIRQTADPVDQQPFPQAQRQTGDMTKLV